MLTRLVALTAAAAILVAGAPSLTLGAPQLGRKEEKKKADLGVGSTAPALSIEKWIKGNEVKNFEAGKVYVVEFWATWCPPCVDSIPHLTELQKTHKDAVIIGVAGSERSKDSGEAEKTVDQFVKKQGKKMEYRVAFDADRSMSEAWMKPAGQGGIPTAFVVGGDGKLAWIGHPMNGLDKAVEDALKKAKRNARAIPAFQPAVPVLATQDAAKAQQEKKERAKPEITLKPGDKAPAIQVGKFIKGEPITAFEKGQVYVVEFWATWCGPCIQAIPHITKLQAEYKDRGVRMLGVSIWESDQSKVQPFVTKQGEKMEYTVAMDNVPEGKDANEGAMAKTWMAPAGRNGIPSTFIVDKEGKVAWIGHPMQMDRPLKEIVAGTFDVKKEAELARKAAEGQKALSTFMRAMESGKTADAYKLGDDLLKAFDGNAMALNQISWTIVDPEGDVKDRDLNLAFKAATRAVELTDSKDGAILDTLARVHFWKGEIDKALELQTKAVEVADGPMKEQLQGALDEYKAKKGK